MEAASATQSFEFFIAVGVVSEGYDRGVEEVVCLVERVLVVGQGSTEGEALVTVAKAVAEELFFAGTCLLTHRWPTDQQGRFYYNTRLAVTRVTSSP